MVEENVAQGKEESRALWSPLKTTSSLTRISATFSKRRFPKLSSRRYVSKYFLPHPDLRKGKAVSY